MLLPRLPMAKLGQGRLRCCQGAVPNPHPGSCGQAGCNTSLCKGCGFLACLRQGDTSPKSGICRITSLGASPLWFVIDPTFPQLLIRRVDPYLNHDDQHEMQRSSFLHVKPLCLQLFGKQATQKQKHKYLPKSPISLPSNKSLRFQDSVCLGLLFGLAKRVG